MSMWTLYLLVKLDSLVSFLGWNVFFIILILGGMGIYTLCIVISQNPDSSAISGWRGTDRYDDIKSEALIAYDAKINSIRNIITKFSILFLTILFLYKAVPTTKEIAFIYIVGKMSQAESAQRIGDEAIKVPEKALQILNYHLDDYLGQFKPKVVEGEK